VLQLKGCMVVIYIADNHAFKMWRLQRVVVVAWYFGDWHERNGHVEFVDLDARAVMQLWGCRMHPGEA